MPGANTDLSISRPDDDRGVRSPRHTQFMYRHLRNRLNPWMLAPVRPGETLLGVSLQGETNTNGILQVPVAPMIYAEVGLWYIPLSTYPQWFLDVITASAEDSAERSGQDVSGTGVLVTTDAVGDQGHKSQGLQHKPRQWAGELGDAAGTDDSSVYLPYTSHGTYKVARDWYDMDIAGSFWNNDDLFDNPPIIEDYIRSVQRSAFDLGLAGVDVDPTAASWFSELVERMYLLTQPEMTYAEYLAAHGVNPRRAGGLCMPVMLDHAMLNPVGSPTILHTGASGTANRDDVDLSDTWKLTAFTAGGGSHSIAVDQKPVAMFGNRWNSYRKRSLSFDEPGFLLGTVTYWEHNARGDMFAHLAGNRMTHPGHWGNRAFGGIEEQDFIATQSLYQQSGAAPTVGQEAGQTSGIYGMNMLNLYLHGDETALGEVNGLNIGPQAFGFRGPGGDFQEEAYLDLSSKLSCQLHIATDMVGGE